VGGDHFAFGSRARVVIAFSNGRATLIETAPGVSVKDVLAQTEAKLAVPDQVPAMNL
jgi:acetate CoA/acetoacetate CoA-transferase beta subunit